jgi:hypothetical protein
MKKQWKKQINKTKWKNKMMTKCKSEKKGWIRFYSQIGWRPFMVHTTFEVKLGEDLSCFTQHLKSNWVKTSLVSHNIWSQIGQRPLLFHTTLEVKLDGEWTPFVSHKGGSQISFLFLVIQKPSKYTNQSFIWATNICAWNTTKIIKNYKMSTTI